jgi:hypothetical protein
VVGQGQEFTTYRLAGLAAVAAARGDAERAGLLWGVVERLEEERGFKLWHIERARYDGFIASVAGRSTFDEAVLPAASCRWSRRSTTPLGHMTASPSPSRWRAESDRQKGRPCESEHASGAIAGYSIQTTASGARMPDQDISV